MAQPLLVAEKPCSTCPYRRDTPPGIWDECEYRKLPEYDDNPPSGMQAFGLFLCHHSPDMTREAVCRGWLSVHSQSVAVRLSMMQGVVTPEQVYAEPIVKLYASGREACDAGMAGIDAPGVNAQRAIDKLITKQKKRRARRKSRARSKRPQKRL